MLRRTVTHSPLDAPPPPPAPSPPLDLPRQVMRRAGVLATAVLLLALLAGLVRMHEDIDEEVDAAVALAGLVAQLSTLQGLDDAQALAALQALQDGPPLRHLSLQLVDAQGRERLRPPPAQASAWPMRALLAVHRDWLSPPEQRVVSWALSRPDGSRWTVSLRASREAERREAMVGLLGTLALLLLAVAALLVVMQVNLRRAFAPLQGLLQAIAGIERGQTAPVRALPPMPVRELDLVAQALRHLAQALDDAEAERRVLHRRVITLQDDERSRLARELHDEFGQQLAALHVDAAWLARRLAADPQAQEVVRSVTAHCRHIQQELKSVLARLRPLQGLGDEAIAPEAVADLLRSLVHGWAAAPAPAPRVRLQLQGLDAPGPGPWPAALVSNLYRITQEALTNAARHAQAAEVEVQVSCTPATGPGPRALRWSVRDDGVGLADPAAALLRGSGLAGLRERVLALGAELQIGPGLGVTPGRPGLGLEVRLTLGADDAADAADGVDAGAQNRQRTPADQARGAPGA